MANHNYADAGINPLALSLAYKIKKWFMTLIAGYLLVFWFLNAFTGGMTYKGAGEVVLVQKIRLFKIESSKQSKVDVQAEEQQALASK